MKKLFAIILLLSAFSVQAEVEFFEGSINDAFKKARKEKKFIYIDCSTDWCYWCKVMEKETFSKPEVAEFMNKNFIALKLDMEIGEGRELGMKYRVMGYPTSLFFNNEGFLLEKHAGYLPMEDFLKTCREVMEKPANTNLVKLTNDIKFPDFYKNTFRNKASKERRKQPTAEQLNGFYKNQKDRMNEVCWSVMLRCGMNEVMENYFIENRAAYETKYGTEEVESAFSRIISKKLKAAIESKEEGELKALMSFIDKNVDSEDKELQKLQMRMQFYFATEDFDQYIEGLHTLTDSMDFKLEMNQSIANQYGWNLYKKCEHREVLDLATEFMQRLLEQNEDYMYLDTYAALLYKIERYEEAMQAAKLAVEKGLEKEANVKETEALIKKIEEKLNK